MWCRNRALIKTRFQAKAAVRRRTRSHASFLYPLGILDRYALIFPTRSSSLTDVVQERRKVEFHRPGPNLAGTRPANDRGTADCDRS